MRINHHLSKAERFEATLGKLDYEDDYETMIEDFLLAAAHYLNAAMHKLHTLPEDRDIKHNQLAGFLKREHAIGIDSDSAAELILQLEQLRPSHVYGKGENGNTAKRADGLFKQIRELSQKVLKNES